MTFKFIDYEVKDDGIVLHFISPDPGAGKASDYYIFLTDSELAGISTQLALKTTVTTKLQRKLQAAGIATKLDPFIGQSLVI